MTDLADSSQLGTSQRVREKMVKISQATHTSTATPVAATRGERMEKDRRIQEAEVRAQAAEERAREAERAKATEEMRRQETERNCAEQVCIVSKINTKYQLQFFSSDKAVQRASDTCGEKVGGESEGE